MPSPMMMVMHENFTQVFIEQLHNHTNVKQIVGVTVQGLRLELAQLNHVLEKGERECNAMFVYQ
jgi:hypothetical protein